MKMTGHMQDSVEEARKELRDAIKSAIRADSQEIVERLKACAETEGIEKD